MEWAYGLTLECWEYFSSSLLSIMSMDYAYMKSHVPVMVSITQVLLAVGWALLIGNLVFQALKSMAVGLGFEGEDPKLLFTRTFVFAFLLMASPQICEVGLSLTARIIIKYHANISKALNDAVRLEKIPMTPLKRGMRPKQVEHIGKFYTLSEVEHLLSCVKGDGAEFPVLMAAFYGLRRSEIMGLKWEAIDFDANTITIAHVVVEVSIDGKYTIVAKDRPKNKKSYRTLPLVPEYRRLLLQMKKHQEEYRELCGNCYHESDYIYVNDIGEQIKPNYVTQHFKLVLRKNNLREITFHELRHTCASLLLKSGISMKDIQAWLGHSNYNTTANIYAHLESNSKELTGNAMQGNLTISGNLAAMQE